MKKSKIRKLTSIFAYHITNLIELKRRIGYRFEQRPSILLYFDRYLCDLNYQGQLTQELALNFSTSNPQMSRNRCVRKNHIIRFFSDCLATFIQDTPPQRPGVLKQISGLAASTGLRISEVVLLDRADINLETGILTVRQSKF
jgi:integrase